MSNCVFCHYPMCEVCGGCPWHDGEHHMPCLCEGKK